MKVRRKKLKTKKDKKNIFKLREMLFVGILLILCASFIYHSKQNTTNNARKDPTQNVEARTKDDSASLQNISLHEVKGAVQNAFCLQIPVILYHHIEPIEEAKEKGHAQLTVDLPIFEQHLQYLVDHGYKTISADELVNALINRQNIPGKPIVITIDDGYSDIYTYAFPLIKKYNVVVNLMIATGLLENSEYLSWNNLQEMVISGLIFAYDHTWSHVSLTTLSEEKSETEIITGKRQLEEHLGRQIKIFTYPYGSFSQKDIDILKRNGFTGAFSTTASFNQCDNFIFSLHRNHVGNAPLSVYGL